MALLKSGSTVGGNLIWHQGIMPMFPAGESIYWKNYKIYTTHDKPTTDELNTFNKTQLNRVMSQIGGTDGNEVWYKMGTVNLPQSGNMLKFEIIGGAGFNGNSSQNRYAIVTLRTGNNSSTIAVNSLGRMGIRVINYDPMIIDIGAIETARDVYDIYIKLPGFSNGTIMTASGPSIEGLNSRWTPKWERQSENPAVTQNRSIERVYTTLSKPSKSDVGLGNVTNDAQVKKSGDTITGVLKIQNEPSVNTTPILELVSNSTASPLRLRRDNSDENISICFDAQTQLKYLGLSRNGELRWGNNINQQQNAKVYTTDHRPSNTEVQSFYQAPTSLGTRNLNDVSSPGEYWQEQNSNAITTRNYPLAKAGTLTVHDNRANTNGVTQEYRPYDQSIVYTRRRVSGTWSSWSKSYTEENKPTFTELQMVSDQPRGLWNFAENHLRWVSASEDGPEPVRDFFGLHMPGTNADWATQIAARTNRFFIRTREAGTWQTWARVYTDQFKPTKSDVGLGNVTNDAQVKKVGDTMTGKLTINNALDVKDNSLFRAGLTVNGNLDVLGKTTSANIESKGTLSVTGSSTLNSVTASSALVTGDLNVSGKISTADLSVTKNLSINGYVTIEDTIEVKKAGTFRDVLTVNGDINGTKNINAEGTVSARTGAMTVYAPAADNGTTHLWFRNTDGKERAVIYSPTENRRAVAIRAGAGSDNSPTVTWTFNGSNGEITLPGGARIAADGNTISSRWGNVWLTDWVQGLFNECAQWVRTGAQQDFGEIGRKHPGKTVPVGWVLVGLNAMDTESNQNLRLWGGRLQVWKQGKNWIDSAT